MRANSRIKIYTVLVLLFFLEVMFFGRFRIRGATPEILLIATIFFGFHFGGDRGAEAGLVSGILKDAASLTAFGISALCFLSIGILAGYIRKKLAKENFITEFFISGLSVYLISGIYFLDLDKLAGRGATPGFWVITFYTALYTAFAAPLLFFILTGIFGPRERSRI